MLKAIFTDGVDEITVHGLTQWDKGRNLQITLSSLPATFQVHFANKRSETAYVVEATASNGVATIDIPNPILQNARDAIAWVYLTDGVYGETVKAINLPIQTRAKPANYTYTEEQGTGVTQYAVQYTPQTLTPEQQAQARENIGAADAGIVIPDYWVEHLAEKIATIKELQRAGGPDCYSYVVIADFHHPHNKASYSPALIKRIMDECGIRFCLCLGDIQSGGAWGTKGLEMADWEGVEKDFAPIRDRTLMIPGNHDGAYGKADINGDGEISGTTDYYIYNLTRDEMYDLVYRKVSLINGVTFDESYNGYYVDDTAAKVRYILVNTHYSDGATNEDGTAVNNYMRKIRVGQPQMDMVVNALQNVPTEEWHVVVGMHIPLAEVGDSGPSSDMVLLRDTLEAYQNRAAYANTFGTAGEYDHISLDVDFSSAKGQVAGVFCGHIHQDDANTEYAFPVITSMSDQTSTAKIAGVVVSGEVGTVSEQSFDVFTVNKREGAIYATKVGYGSDRIFSIGDSYTVSLSLDGASASNEDKLVQQNGSYSNTITAKAGYEIDTVTVTMGGVDVTEDVYANGIVTIGTVTGSVVITVTATAVYTNLADPTSEDWCSESHFIDSYGNFSEQNNPVYNATLVVTNFIPVVKGDILRWMGIDMEGDSCGYPPAIKCYDENKEFIRNVSLRTDALGTVNGLPTSCVTDENGVTAWEIMIRGDTGEQFVYQSLCDKIRYVRFCAHWATTEENIVITVNEEII